MGFDCHTRMRSVDCLGCQPLSPARVPDASGVTCYESLPGSRRCHKYVASRRRGMFRKVCWPPSNIRKMYDGKSAWEDNTATKSRSSNHIDYTALIGLISTSTLCSPL